MDNNLKFEILALNTPEQSSILSELDLLYLLRSNSLLWETPLFDETSLRITDGTNTLEVKRVKANTENDEEFRSIQSQIRLFW